jgi:tagatose 6-phosphate kinase
VFYPAVSDLVLQEFSTSGNHEVVMATILTITANPLVDHVTSGRIATNQVNRIGHFRALAGGKGLNVGRVLARHGHHVIATGFAGGPLGELLTTLTAADGMEPAFVPTAARTRIGFMAIDHDKGDCTSVLEHGSPVSATELGAFMQKLRALLSGINLVIIGGSVPHDTCNNMYRQVLDLCAREKITCWVDAYGPAMEEALSGINPPLLAKPNKQEYGKSRSWLACRELHLTDGPHDIKIRHPEGRFRIKPPKIKASSSIGSGDCYVAALAHARLSGWPLEEQFAYAAAAGTANAVHGNIAHISPTDIREQLKSINVTRVEQ